MITSFLLMQSIFPLDIIATIAPTLDSEQNKVYFPLFKIREQTLDSEPNKVYFPLFKIRTD